MKNETKKHLNFAIKNLKITRQGFSANASGDQIFDFQVKAKEHYLEYTEAIEYLEKLIEQLSQYDVKQELL